VVFEYHDPLEEYKNIVLDSKLSKQEKEVLWNNMQRFLDEEKVVINGKRTYPKVVDIEIGFREDYKHPYISFFIVFLGEFKKGVNVYEDEYEAEVAEYPYTVYWVFPLKARVVSADLGVPYTILGNGRILSFTVPRGTRIRGYERIEFELN